LAGVCRPQGLAASKSLPSDSDLSTTSEPATPRRPTALQIGDRNNVVLIRIAFQSLTLVCDTLSSLSSEHLRLCISTLGLFGKQTDTNIALTAAESLMWGVSDSIQSKRKDVEKEPEYSALWMFLLLELLGLCTDARHEVRVGAIQTLFRSLQLYGATLSLNTWDECIWKVIFPLLDSITASIRQTESPPPTADTTATTVPGSGQSWDESKTLALQSLSSIFSDFLTLKIIHLGSFSDAWRTFVSHVEDSFFFDSRSVSTAALRCLERALDALKSTASDASLVPAVSDASERVWMACDEMGNKLSKSTAASALQSPQSGTSSARLKGMGISPFSQDSLLAFVDVIKKTREASKVVSQTQQAEGSAEFEWPIARLNRLMAILKGVITYSNSPEYRPDIDGLTPVQVRGFFVEIDSFTMLILCHVQAAVMSTISTISFSIPSSPSLVLSDLSSYATLPFLAAFDVQGHSPPAESSSHQTPKRVTYTALAKKTMPMLVDLYLEYKDSQEIYADGTMEAVLSVCLLAWLLGVGPLTDTSR
jgi:protein MON2